MNVGFMDHPVWGRYCRRHNTDLGGEVALCWNRRLTQQPSAQRFIAFTQTFFAGLLQYQKPNNTANRAECSDPGTLCD